MLPSSKRPGTLFLLKFALVFLMLFGASEAMASHFRFAHFTWERVGDATSTTVKIKVVHAWRIAPSSISLGDGSILPPGTLVSTPTDLSGAGYQVYENETTHTYPHQGPFTIQFNSCCRIFGLVNANSSNFRVQTIVDLRNGQTGSSIAAIPPIFQMNQGVQDIPLPVTDPDGTPTCRMATSTESQIPSVASVAAPGGGTSTLSVTSDCRLQWDTTLAPDNARYAAQVIIEEGGIRTALDFIIEINPGLVNDDPPTCVVNGPVNNDVPVGVPFTISVTGTDPEAGDLTLSTFGLPTGMTVVPSDGTTAASPLTATFNWTPSSVPAGGAVNVIFADSSNQQASCGFSVSARNSIPVADAGPDQTVNENTGVNLDGSGSSDPLNGTLTYAWTQVAGPAVSLTGANTVNPSFTAPNVASNTVLTFSLVVNNGIQNSAPDTVDITVLNVNTPPVADAGADQTVEQTSPAGASVTLDGSGSSDAENDPLTYSWTGPFGSASGVSPTVNIPAGTHVVTLVVNDGEENSVPDTVTIIVEDTIPPVISTSDITVEATGPTTPVDVGAVTSATDDVGVVSLTNDNGGPFPVGSTVVTWTACDAAGNCSNATQTVTVTDTTAPDISNACLTDKLWPPNHKLVNAVSGSASDAVGPVTVTVDVTSNQPLNGTGDGNTDSDWLTVVNPDGSYSVKLRAERAGNLGQRDYTVTVTATDGNGNTSTETCAASVPHDQGKNNSPSSKKGKK